MRHRLFCTLLTALVSFATASLSAQPDYSLYLATGTVRPGTMRSLPMAAAATTNRHLLMQFDGPLTDDQRAGLAEDGILLQQYVPNFAYTVLVTQPLSTQLMQRHGIRWIDFVQPDIKVSPALRDPGGAPWAVRPGDSIQLTVVFHADESLTAAAGAMQQMHGARILGMEPTTNALDIIVPVSELTVLPQLEAVLFVEPALPEPIEHNNSSRQNINADPAQATPYSLDGSGIMLAQWDGGRADATHGDFGGRIIQTDGSPLSTHATHVAGTVLGSGAGSSGTYKGMAPGAQMLSKQWFNASSDAFTDYQSAITNHGARVSQNSWGYGPGDPATQSSCDAVMGNYWSISGTIDNIVRGDAGAPIIAVWSAGNQRGSSSSYCGSLGWTYNTTDPLASAKNVITVGAVNSNNSTMTSFSSWGPTDDGRLKPDVVGPGCQSSSDFGVTSCRQGAGYTVMCGTSMSAPAVSGVIALVLQRHGQLFPLDTLLPSTVKGLLINSAVDLGTAGPDFQYGHGKVDALAAVKKVEAGEPSYVEGSATTGGTAYYDLTVPEGASKIRVTLVWDDPGAGAISGLALINDLDLRLIDPTGAEVMPWLMSAGAPSTPAVRAADHLNNVETVEWASPEAGMWRAKVTGYNVPQGPQKYSLVFTPDSLYGPGSLHALSVVDFADTALDPGQSMPAEFKVVNLGSGDSVLIQLADSAGWMAPAADTVVYLGPGDSVAVSSAVSVPPSALFGQSEVITCVVTSVSDSAISSASASRVSAKRYYGLSASVPDADTVNSPSTLIIPVTITNLGNSTDNIIVTVTNDSLWTVQPTNLYLPLSTGNDTSFSITLTIPSEVPPNSTNLLKVKAVSSGGLEITDTIAVFVLTSLATPSLLAPEPVIYSPTRLFTFEWRGVGDSFSVYIATDSMLTSLVRSYPGIVDTTLAMPAADSLMDGTYYWGVRAHVGVDSSALQRQARKLGVDNQAPMGVTPQSPISGYVTVKPFDIEMASNGSGQKVAPEYVTVQFCHDSLFATDLVVFDTLVPLQFVTPQILAEGRWYWRARRFDLAGNASAWSSTVNFLLDTEVPATPGLLAPADGAASSGSIVLLDWSATPPSGQEQSPEYYHVHVSKNSNFTDFTTFNQDVMVDSVALPTSLLIDARLYYWRVRAVDSAGLQSVYSTTRTFVWYNFVCGDLDKSTTVDIGDLTAMIQYLFLGGPAPQPLLSGSLTCDDSIDISDLTWMIAFLFMTGPEPCCQ